MIVTTSRQIVIGFNGWKNLIFKKTEVEQLAEHRRQICSCCEHRKETTCGLCGCPLGAKQRAMEASCPDGRWLASSAKKAA